MEKQELISVIIPVYNVEEYLRECVDSVLKQTYEAFEVILVDDGSTEGSGDICDEYVEMDTRVQVIHQKNQGLSGARNTGFASANGKYVYFLDSDDWILPETLEELEDKAEKEEAEVVFFDANSFADNPEEFLVEQRYIRKHAYETEEGYKVLEKLQKNQEYHSAVPLLFLKKEFLQDRGIRFESGILYEDMLNTYEVYCKAKRAAHIQKAFYQRRYRSNSIMTSRKNQRHYISAMMVYKKAREGSEQIGKLEDDTARKYVIRCAFNALNMYNKLSRADKRICKAEYINLKKEIMGNKAYNDNALKMRCYGTFAWFIYKIYEKSLGRILKGSN